MLLYEYRCPSHGVFEKLTNMEDRQDKQKCPVCDFPSPFVLSAPHFDIRMGLDGSMSTMADKWEKMHIQKASEDEA